MPSCCVCNRGFDSANSLQQHQSSKGHIGKYSPPLPMYKCPTCPESFAEPKSLKLHQISTGHCYCVDCKQDFAKPPKLLSHNTRVHQLKCPKCVSVLRNKVALRAHQKSASHCYCSPCEKTFSSTGSYDRHLIDAHRLPCSTCGKVFADTKSLTAHKKSSGHCYCRDCKLLFANQAALTQHMALPLHAVGFRCCDCDRDFVNEQALNQHLTNKVHKVHKVRKVNHEHQCGECERSFKSTKALAQHLQSLAHRPLSNIKCTAGGGCQKTFTSPSAMLLHLESGSCQSGMTRDTLNVLVHECDVENHITGPKAVLPASTIRDDEESEGYDSSTNSCGIRTPVSSVGGVLLSPSITSLGQLTPSTDSSSFEMGIARLSNLHCPLCPASRASFVDFAALQKHISSAAHLPKAFHCPKFFFPSSAGSSKKAAKAVKLFSTLSGLAQHLESGKCRGGSTTFRKAVNFLEEKLRQMGFKQPPLLLS